MNASATTIPRKLSPVSATRSQTHSTTQGHRIAFPILALGASIGAAVAFAVVGGITRHLGGNSITMTAGAAVMLLASVLLPAPATRTWSLLLVWNGLGVALALMLIGIFSVGALVIFPLALIALALSGWPRQPGESIASAPAIAAHLAGFGTIFLIVYGQSAAQWLQRLVGW
jgi:hypothetical protein